MLLCWRTYKLRFIRFRLLDVLFVAYCQLVTSLCAAASQYLTAILRAHTRTEAMLVGAAAAGWLKCSFHRYIFGAALAAAFQKVTQR